MTKQFETQAIAAMTAQALEVKEVAGIPFFWAFPAKIGLLAKKDLEKWGSMV